MQKNTNIAIVGILAFFAFFFVFFCIFLYFFVFFCFFLYFLFFYLKFRLPPHRNLIGIVTHLTTFRLEPLVLKVKLFHEHDAMLLLAIILSTRFISNLYPIFCCWILCLFCSFCSSFLLVATTVTCSHLTSAPSGKVHTVSPLSSF